MSGSHLSGVDGLYVGRQSPVHRLAPEVKVASLAVFVLLVALTPRRSVLAFLCDGLAIVGVCALARLPFRRVLKRLAVVLPFVAFSFALPFIGGGDKTIVFGLHLSSDGLWSTWNICAKAVIGATASIVLSSTTRVPDMLTGLSRLKVPRILVAIISFMVRYLDLLSAQLGRMRTSMVARCHDPRWLWQVKPIASSAGALFVRSYERGERIHQAMLARGYDGTMRELSTPQAAGHMWFSATCVPLVALVGLVGSVMR